MLVLEIQRSRAGHVRSDAHGLAERRKEVVASAIGRVAVDMDAAVAAAVYLVAQRQIGLPLAAISTRLARSRLTDRVRPIAQRLVL